MTSTDGQSILHFCDILISFIFFSTCVINCSCRKNFIALFSFLKYILKALLAAKSSLVHPKSLPNLTITVL